MANAIGELSTVSPTGLWVLPPPGSGSTPVVSGALPEHLALLNTSDATISYLVYAVRPSGSRTVGSGTLAAGMTATVSNNALFGASLNPIIVRTSGPVAVSEDVGPTGSVGVITMPGIPLAAAIGL
jgi:hypothetical protein